MDGEWLTCVPAYYRDYTTAEAVLADWNADKDFLIQDVSCPHNGRYVNRGDATRQSGLRGTTFKIRYSKLENFTLIRQEDGVWKSVGVSDGSEIDANEVEADVDGCTEADHGDQPGCGDASVSG